MPTILSFACYVRRVPSIRAPRPHVPPAQAFRHLLHALGSFRTWHALWTKMGHDRVLMRSSALAFDTLLSIVPLTAVIMAATRALSSSEQQDALLRYVVDQYVPAATGGAIDRLLPLVARLDLRTVGIVGLVALLPVIFSLVDSVEAALSDIFRAPRRNHWWRLVMLGGLLTLAPLGSLLTVRYVPWDALAFDHVVTPLLAITLLLYGVFRRLPSVEVRDRAAITGALTTGMLLSLSKAGFGLYATHLASSIHLLWGAIAFVPLMLVWVLLSWYVVLLGAEVAAVLEQVLGGVEGSHPPSRHPVRRTSRLRRRVRRFGNHPKTS